MPRIQTLNLDLLSSRTKLVRIGEGEFDVETVEHTPRFRLQFGFGSWVIRSLLFLHPFPIEGA